MNKQLQFRFTHFNVQFWHYQDCKASLVAGSSYSADEMNNAVNLTV